MLFFEPIGIQASDGAEKNDQARRADRIAILDRQPVQESRAGHTHIVTAGPRERILWADTLERLENRAC